MFVIPAHSASLRAGSSGNPGLSSQEDKTRGFMKKFFAVPAVSVIIPAVFSVLAVFVPQAMAAPETFASATTVDTIDRMAGEVLDRFPRAEGKVTAADEKTVTVDIGAKDGLFKGVEVYLFRQGKPIFHPVTKAVLGYREISLGSFIVDKLGAHEASGRIKKLLVTQIIPGDTARLSTRKTRLLFVSGGDVNEPIKDRLFHILRGSGRFDMPGAKELTKPAVKGDMAGLAKASGAQYVLTLATSPTKRPDRTKVGIALYAADGTETENLSSLVDSTSSVYKAEEMGIPLVIEERRDFFYMDELPYRAEHFAAGNIMGDGKTELAISTGDRIIIYRLEKGVLHELWREPEAHPAAQLDVECADIDGDGRDEVYVTAYGQGRAQSYVIKYDGKDFRKVYGPSPVLFKVLDMPDGKKKLLTTTVGTESPYSGIIYQSEWKNGRLVRESRFKLPSRIQDPYGFAILDVPGKTRQGKKTTVPIYVWVDDNDYVEVLDHNGKKLWESNERYGGYDNFFEVKRKSMIFAGADDRGKVKGRVIVRTGPEGEKEVVITKNNAATNIIRRWHGYSGAEIYSFVWDGKGLEQKWSVKNIGGYLADIYLGDVLNDGRDEIAIITDPTFELEHKSKLNPIGGVSSVTNGLASRAKLLLYKIPQR